MARIYYYVLPYRADLTASHGWYNGSDAIERFKSERAAVKRANLLMMDGKLMVVRSSHFVREGR